MMTVRCHLASYWTILVRTTVLVRSAPGKHLHSSDVRYNELSFAYSLCLQVNMPSQAECAISLIEDFLQPVVTLARMATSPLQLAMPCKGTKGTNMNIDFWEKLASLQKTSGNEDFF